MQHNTVCCSDNVVVEKGTQWAQGVGALHSGVDAYVALAPAEWPFRDYGHASAISGLRVSLSGHLRHARVVQ